MMNYWAFPDRNWNPPVNDIYGKFQGGHGKFDWKSRGGEVQRNRHPQQGGNFFFLFFWKSPLEV